jgi:hypothetical protein
LIRPFDVAMGIFSEQKPYSAVTNWVEQLCSEQYDEDDYTGVPDLCDVARLQDTGYCNHHVLILPDRQKLLEPFARS